MANEAKPERLNRDGIPIAPNDWTVEDWRDLHIGMEAIKARIRARHARWAEVPGPVPAATRDRAGAGEEGCRDR